MSSDFHNCDSAHVYIYCIYTHTKNAFSSLEKQSHVIDPMMKTQKQKWLLYDFQINTVVRKLIDNVLKRKRKKTNLCWGRLEHLYL